MPACPTCKRPVPKDGAFSPFCTDRCRLVDLGAWLSESYRIPTRPSEEEDEEALPRKPDPAPLEH